MSLKNDINSRSRSKKDLSKMFSSSMGNEKSFEVGNLNFKSLSNNRLSGSIKEGSRRLPKANSSVFNNTGLSLLSTVAGQSTNNMDINELDDIATLRLLCKNLRGEVKAKNEYIKNLENNIKEKLKQIELENKTLVESVESQYKEVIDAIATLNEKKVNELVYQNNLLKNQYEEMMRKLSIEYSYDRFNMIGLAEHTEAIRGNDNRWKSKYEDLKGSFIEKLNELIAFFDRNEYRVLLEKINLYAMLCEKLGDLDVDDKLKCLIEDNKTFLNSQEYDIWVSKVKLKTIQIESEFIKGISDIETTYITGYKYIDNKQSSKLDKLQVLLDERFKVFVDYY
jgi:hypothetical protein